MKKRLSKDQWLDNALKLINQQDFGSLTIDRLVASLGVTKGSFYWHFKNRKDFVLQLIGYWDTQFTQLVIKHIAKFEGTEKDRLLELMLFITNNQLAKYDFAIQALVQSEPEIFPRVQKVLNRRFTYVATLFSDMGFSEADSKFRSRATVMFMIQEQNSLVKESKKEQLEQIQLAHALFTGM